MNGYQVAVEVRNRGWLNDKAVQETLMGERDLGLAHVIN